MGIGNQEREAHKPADAEHSADDRDRDPEPSESPVDTPDGGTGPPGSAPPDKLAGRNNRNRGRQQRTGDDDAPVHRGRAPDRPQRRSASLCGVRQVRRPPLRPSRAARYGVQCRPARPPHRARTDLNLGAQPGGGHNNQGSARRPARPPPQEAHRLGISRPFIVPAERPRAQRPTSPGLPPTAHSSLGIIRLPMNRPGPGPSSQAMSISAAVRIAGTRHGGYASGWRIPVVWPRGPGTARTRPQLGLAWAAGEGCRPGLDLGE